MSDSVINSGNAQGMESRRAGVDPGDFGAESQGVRTRFTVFIPVRNESRYIRQTLQQLYDQDYPKELYEVIVADGESDDGTPDIVRDFARQHPDFALTLINNPVRLSSGARNRAIRSGKGDYFLLVDGHVYIPSRQLLRNADRLIRETGASVLGRPQPLDPPDITSFQRDLAIIRSSPLAHSVESLIYSDYEGWASPLTIGTLYHRSVFEAVGLFDEQFDAAEDLEFNYRLEKLGFQCYTSPELEIKYYPRHDVRSLFRQLQRYGLGRARFILKHPERLTWEVLVPPAFVLFLTLGALIALMLPGFGWLWLATLALYVGLVAIEGVRLSLAHGRFLLHRALQLIPVVHVALGWGFLKGLLGLLKKRSDA
ncbi:glycosyltransferase family 2 protein [Hahella sp. SMD15-11]|uniref:Glycosyltransferase family 2 protein n=1 Tax=Thermohahella caldifontis TaxID=3142973 RepID=A0AB39UYM0_9GAMM